MMIIMMMIKSMTIDLDQRRWTSWQSAEKQSHHLALTLSMDGDNVDYHYNHYLHPKVLYISPRTGNHPTHPIQSHPLLAYGATFVYDGIFYR